MAVDSHPTRHPAVTQRGELGPEHLEEGELDPLPELVSADTEFDRYPWDPSLGSNVEQRRLLVDDRRMKHLWKSIRSYSGNLWQVPAGILTDYPLMRSREDDLLLREEYRLAALQPSNCPPPGPPLA